MRKRARDTSLIFVGAIFLVGSGVCLLMSLVGGSELRRWQAAPSIQEPGALRSAGQGEDVTLVGAIAPQTPVVREGLCLYEYWEQEIEYKGGRQTSKWRHNYDYDHKPTFELVFGGHAVSVQSDFVVFHNSREIMPDRHIKLKGFTPGDTVTVLGAVVSSDEPFVIQAEYVCGGERERCMEQLARSSIGPAIGAVILFLIGGGLAGLGVKTYVSRP